MGIYVRPVFANGKTVWIVSRLDDQKVIATGSTLEEVMGKIEEQSKGEQ